MILRQIKINQLRKKKIIDLYKSAASQGDEKALNLLGMIYYRKGNQNEAIKWYKQAANLGNLKACNKLGNILQQSGHSKDALFGIDKQL